MPAFKPMPRGRRAPEFDEIAPTRSKPRDPIPATHAAPVSPPARQSAAVPPVCWRVARVARHLDISRKRVYQLVEEGKLEAIRTGPRGMRILVPSIEKYLTRSLIPPGGAG